MTEAGHPTEQALSRMADKSDFRAGGSTHVFYDSTGNFCAEVILKSDQPLNPEIRYGRAVFDDHPQLGLIRQSTVPASLEKRVCAALADISRQHEPASQTRADYWTQRAASAVFQEKISRLFRAQERDR